MTHRQPPLLFVSWFPGCTEPDAVALFADAGVTGIETRQVGEEAARIRAAGMSVSFHLPTPPGGEPETNLASEDVLQPFRDGRLAQITQSDLPFLGFHFGYSCTKIRKMNGPDLPLGPPLACDDMLRRMTTSVAELHRLTDRQVLVENLDYGPTGAMEYIWDPALMARFCRDTGCGALWDIAHAEVTAQARGYPIQEFLAWSVRELAPVVREIHVNAPRQGADAHASPGELELAWLGRMVTEAAGGVALVSLERAWGNQHGLEFARELLSDLARIREALAG